MKTGHDLPSPPQRTRPTRGLHIAIIGSRGYPVVYSGYETLVKELGERLAGRGYRITVYNHRHLFSRRPRTLNGIRLVYIPTIERKTMSQLVHSFQAMVHACFQDFDLILVVNSANGPLGILSKTMGKKTVINVDGLEWRRPKWKGLGAAYFYRASKMATRLYDVVVTDCSAMQAIYEKEFRCSSRVIAYGAERRFSNRPGLISKWGLASRDYYLVVGRLIPDNNADLILREFCRSRSRRKLVIVGDVPYRDRYARDLKSIPDPRLLFTGYVRVPQELDELYLNCHAYLHGHEFGGTNPSLLMALGSGCAVCALETSFNREVLKNGEYGIFFSKEPDSLKTRIEDLELRPEVLDRLRKISRDRIAESYTWDKIVGQYADLFDKIIHGR